MLDFQSDQAKTEIMEEISLLGLTDDQKSKIMSGLLETISARINIAVFDKLSSEDKKKVIKLAESKDKNTIFNYLNIKIPDLSNIAKEIIKETVQEFKSLRGY